MGRKNDAASVTAPVLDVESRVVLRQERIAPVAEDAFHEIQIAHQTGGGKEARFHALLGFAPRGWTDKGPQQ